MGGSTNFGVLGQFDGGANTCVDRSLNLAQIRAYLLSCGIARTPAQVAHDLDHVYTFTGYASTHPAPVTQSVQAFDKAIDRT